MKQNISISLFISCFFFFIVNSAYHVDRVQSRNGRNSNTACYNCHGSAEPGLMELTGIPDEVNANTVYNAQLCISDPTALAAGFRFHSSQGTYSNLGTGVRTGGNGGNLGLTHNDPSDLVNQSTCWTFDWTSPASGNSNVQIYGNAVNDDGANDNADHGGYQLFKVFSIVSCQNDLSILDDPIPGGNYESLNSISASTSTDQNTNILFETANCIDLEAGFEVPASTDFQAIVAEPNACSN